MTGQPAPAVRLGRQLQQAFHGFGIVPQVEGGNEERRNRGQVGQAFVLFKAANMCLGIADCLRQISLGEVGALAQIFELAAEIVDGETGGHDLSFGERTGVPLSTFVKKCQLFQGSF